MAQTQTVTGKIADAKTGQPVIGASVFVKGSTSGTKTNDAGSFSLNAPDHATLVITAVGYLQQEVGANARLDNLLLEPGSKDLDQVVVVGYGTQKKATLTGSVETVSSKAFQDRAVTNIGLALQGETPGLVVTRTSPRPGNEGLNFVIRGLSSVNGSTPLIVVDGTPALNNFSFLNLNPDDIESISVLKDAAGSIYGSAASNGVILVTTKRGKGKTHYDIGSNTRFTTNGITGYSPSMQQYATMWIDANKEEATPNWWVWGTQDNLLKMQQGVEGAYHFATWPNVDYFIFNTNRIKELFATRYSYQNNLSISGGTDKSAYRLSFLMADNKGNLATAYDGQKQYNLRFNYDIKLSDRLKLETGVSVVDAKTSTPSVGLDATLYANDMPFFPAKNPFGQWFPIFNGVDGGANRNPAALTSDGGRDNQNSLTGRVDLKATYQIVKGLSLEAKASMQNERFTEDKYILAVPIYNWYGTRQTGWAGGTDTTKTSYYAKSWTSTLQYYSALLRYNTSFKQLHNISAFAGIEAQKTDYKWIDANRVGFTDLGVENISLASTAVQTNNGFSSQYGNYAYLGRFNYNYAEKYLLELQGRIDGSSRFATGHKFQNYGGASVGWVFTKEDFLNGLNPVLNFGKLRASYGTSGNQATGLGEFDYLSLVKIGTTVLGLPAALQNSSSLLNNGIISYDRTWERVKMKNIALDLGFLKNRLNTTFEYFGKDNIGMLVNVNYPSVLGGAAPKTNSGHFSTKGWEAILKWDDHVKDFAYNIALTLSNTTTKVTGVQGADSYSPGKMGIVNGYPYQPWFVYKTDGYFKDQADVDAYYAQYGSSPDLAGLPKNNAAVALRPGDTKKMAGSGGTITGSGNGTSSLVYAGDGTPHYTFGTNLGASWKGFDISAFFQGQLKQLIMRNGWMSYPFNALYTNQNPSFLGKTWTTDDPNAPYPRLTVNPTRAKWDYANNDFMLQNNRYIRLKALIVGYNLPQAWIRKLKLEKVRVYFSGNDLWELAHVKDGFDPEMGETSQNSGYPFARTWAFGINIGF
ncbi:TonB-linked outer membrane protein [Niabella soli DSM 19437]|uniref:TonB-linked outer membrane protein n=2 Tax=Niabella TaxID=379899 RepID=W0F6H3_9BACT|nr:TonB-linked outer membrane protein [Niabella soli DSM 19437]